MKRMLALTLLSTISLACAMEPELHEPSERTRKYVEQALKAFEVPLGSVKIFGFSPEESIILGGLANSTARFISLNENNKEEASFHYTSFHEAAHIKDNVNAKIQRYANCLTASFLATYLSILPKMIFCMKSKAKLRTPTLSLLVGSYGIFGAIFGHWFNNSAAVQWSIEQGEYRADKMATEKLLSLNQLDPILAQLMSKKLLKKSSGNERILGHPPAREEYKAMKRTIETNGYKVTKYRPVDAPNRLIIELTRNGKGRYIEKPDYYSKV